MITNLLTIEPSSVTDWIQALAAALGVPFLIYSILQQGKTLDLQTKLTEQEFTKSRNAALPVFASEKNYTSAERNGLITVTVTQNPANNIFFSPINARIVDFKTFHRPRMEVGEQVLFPIALPIVSQKDISVILIEFNDDLGNPYYQKISVSDIATSTHRPFENLRPYENINGRKVSKSDIRKLKNIFKDAKIIPSDD